MSRTRSTITAGLLAAAVLALLVWLGFWQLERARIKEDLQARFTSNQARPPAPLADILSRESPQAAYFRPVTAAGRFDAQHQFLLDNRTHEGRAGYHVLTPLVTDGAAILINRGWVPVGPSRSRPPTLAALSNGRVAVSGVLSTPPRPGLVLGDTGHDGPGGPWPRVVQTVDLDAMSTALGYSLASMILLLDPRQPGCHVCAWTPVVGLGSQTHRGYAVQWFALAAALVVLCALMLRRRRRGDG